MSPIIVSHNKPCRAPIQLPMLLPPPTTYIFLPVYTRFRPLLCPIQFLHNLVFCVFLIQFLKFLHNQNLYYLNCLHDFFAISNFSSSALASSFCSLMIAPRPDTTPSPHNATSQTQTRDRLTRSPHAITFKPRPANADTRSPSANADHPEHELIT